MFDGGGTWCESEDDIVRVAESNFQEIFTSSNPTTIEPILDDVDRVVISEMN